MFLRSLVSHWLRQQASEKLRETVAQAAGQGTETSDEPAPDSALPPQTCDVGFVYALGIEAGGLVDVMSDRVTTRGPRLVEHVGTVDSRRVAIVETGVGREAARLGCQDMISVRQPRWIISAGFAGGLGPDMGRGHILMANHVSDVTGHSLSVGLRLDDETIESQPTLHTGRLLTVDRVITRPEEKGQLGQQHSALACDMETIAVAQVCREAKVRFVSVRIISDAVDDELPPELEHLIRQKTLAGKLGAATGAVFRKPGNVKQMWRLKTDAIKLSERLAKFSLGVVAQLE